MTKTRAANQSTHRLVVAQPCMLDEKHSVSVLLIWKHGNRVAGSLLAQFGPARRPPLALPCWPPAANARARRSVGCARVRALAPGGRGPAAAAQLRAHDRRRPRDVRCARASSMRGAVPGAVVHARAGETEKVQLRAGGHARSHAGYTSVLLRLYRFRFLGNNFN